MSLTSMAKNEPDQTAEPTSSIRDNLVVLYSAHFCNYVLPLITIPYTVRVLGPRSWGLVAFSQAFANYVSLIIEYGFGLSAVREVSRYRDSKNGLARVVSGVLGARCLLTIVSILLGAAVVRWVPVARQSPRLLWAGLFWGTSQAFSALWYFQGLERMKTVALVDVSAKLTSTIAVFCMVKAPADDWKVLAALGAGAFLSTAIGLSLVYRDIRFMFPTVADTIDAMRGGWTMFLYRSSVSLYTAGNAFILGLFAPPQLVGYFAGAEKIIRSVLGLFNPINQALLPRMSHLVHRAPVDARRLARQSLHFTAVAGCLLGTLVMITAPLIVRIALGNQLMPAVPALRILALLLPLIGVNYAIGIQWLLPLGMDKPFNAVVLLSGIVNLFMAALLAPGYAHLGMAWAIVSAEAVATVGLVLVLRTAGRKIKAGHSSTSLACRVEPFSEMLPIKEYDIG
jgi:PST family polysaccharide transporter